MSTMLTVTDDDFEQVVLEADMPVVVDFWAPWCGPCRVVGPIFEELSGEMGDRLKFAKLNTDDNPTTARNWRVMSIPTMIVYKDGKEAARIVGAMPKPDLRQKLEQALA